MAQIPTFKEIAGKLAESTVDKFASISCRLARASLLLTECRPDVNNAIIVVTAIDVDIDSYAVDVIEHDKLASMYDNNHIVFAYASNYAFEIYERFEKNMAAQSVVINDHYHIACMQIIQELTKCIQDYEKKEHIAKLAEVYDEIMKLTLDAAAIAKIPMGPLAS